MPIVDNPSTIDVTAFNAGWTFSVGSGIVCDGPTRPFNNTTPPSPPKFAFLTDLGTIQQAFTTTVAGVHTIALQTENRWFPSATQTVRVMVDGVSVGTIPANDGFRWTARSFAPNIPTPGTHTLRFEGVGVTGQTGLSMLLDSVTITPPSGTVTLLNPSFDSYLLSPDQIATNPSALATATLRAAAMVTTGGELIRFSVTPIAGGNPVNSGTINQAPTVSVNGIDKGPLRTSDAEGPLLSTSAHPSFLIPMPAGVVVGPSDVVTLTAPAGWLYGPSGYSEAMAGQSVLNRAGRSFERLVDVPRTMGLGASYYLMAEWHNGFQHVNLSTRLAFWVPANKSEDANKNPLVLGGPSAYGPLVRVGGSSNIDSTGLPTPAGYWAVRFNNRDGHSFARLSNGGAVNTSCTPVPSLDNPGVGGIGCVRVFDFQPTGVIDAANRDWLTNLEVWLQLDSTNAPIAGGYPVAIDGIDVRSPGNFSWTVGQPTVIPLSAWDDMAEEVKVKLPPNLPFGPHRVSVAGITIGDSAACEREQVCLRDDFHWNNDAKTANQIRYIQARPWTNATSPYIYDPLAGTDYNATLGADITTAPASGTIEVITVTDAATAPVIAGLVLTIGTEKLRVMSVTGTAVTVMRGMASTVPTTHIVISSNTITVSARRPIANLAAWSPSNRQITELVTQSPHGLKSGQDLKMDGNGWPPFVYTDGSGFYGGVFNPYFMSPFVTGANTFCVTQPSSHSLSNVTLSTSYTLNPGPITSTNLYECQSLIFLPEWGAVPYESAASISAKHPGAPAWITFCMVASDDMVDSIWRRVLDELPADRDVWVELGNEPWNQSAVPATFWYQMSYMLYGLSGSFGGNYWNAVRSAQIRDRGKAIWAAAGRDPAHVKCELNCQCAPGSAQGIGTLLNFLASKSAVPDAIAVAPYYDHYPDHSMWKVYGAWSTKNLVDAWIWDVYENTSFGGGQVWGGGMVRRTGDYKVAVDAWNSAQTPPGNVKVVIYEYASGLPWPLYISFPDGGSIPKGLGVAMDVTTTILTLADTTAYNPLDDNWSDCAKVCRGTWLRVDEEWMTVVSRSGASVTVNRAQGGTTAAPHAVGAQIKNDWLEGVRDLVLHPSIRIVHYDVLAFIQSQGITFTIPSAINFPWPGGAAWGDYNAIAQLPGIGDGSDGKFDNRLCLARRGDPHTKAANVSQDANTVSPRGQAMIDFMTPSTTGGSGTGHRPVVIHRRRGRAVVA